MFRKCIISFAAAATLGVAALASGPASAHWGGGHHMWAFHHPHFFIRERFVFRHPYFVRHHFALIQAPILIDDGCWRIHRVPTYWGWRWRRVWVCG